MTHGRSDADDEESAEAADRPAPQDDTATATGSDEPDTTDGAGDTADDEPDFSSMPIEEVPEPEVPDVPAYGEDDDQGYVDRDKIDFDPDKGLYSGTLVHGGDSELPDQPSEEQVNAALADIKAGGDGLVDEEGNKVANRQDADD